MDKYKIPTLHKTDTNITTDCGQVFTFPTHIHSYFEILLYEPFDGYVIINDQVIIPDTLTATVIVPGDFHEIVVNNKSDSKFFKISFTTNTFENNFAKTSMVLKSIAYDSLFCKTYNEIMENPSNEQLKKVLLQVIICIMAQNGKSITSVKHSENDYVSETIKIVNEKYDDDISLSSIANLLAITPQYLSNTFKSNTGISFSNYLTAFRLHHAEKLLIETNESITDISYMCGYKNFSHFIRTFKKIYGVTPSIYRKTKPL